MKSMQFNSSLYSFLAESYFNQQQNAEVFLLSGMDYDSTQYVSTTEQSASQSSGGFQFQNMKMPTTPIRSHLVSAHSSPSSRTTTPSKIVLRNNQNAINEIANLLQNQPEVIQNKCMKIYDTVVRNVNAHLEADRNTPPDQVLNAHKVDLMRLVVNTTYNCFSTSPEKMSPQDVYSYMELGEPKRKKRKKDKTLDQNDKKKNKRDKKDKNKANGKENLETSANSNMNTSTASTDVSID